jgi:hypothetical protein
MTTVAIVAAPTWYGKVRIAPWVVLLLLGAEEVALDAWRVERDEVRELDVVAVVSAG